MEPNILILNIFTVEPRLSVHWFTKVLAGLTQCVDWRITNKEALYSMSTFVNKKHANYFIKLLSNVFISK